MKDSTPVKRQAASQSSPRNKRQKIDPNDSNTEVTDMEIENG